MVSPARSAAVKLRLATQAGAELPDQYDEAIETQQMALSLLQQHEEIISSLTLSVSPKQPASAAMKHRSRAFLR
jgi:hypothetical protein